jgi:hypothetical protein
MLDWCGENVAAGIWAEHGHSERRKGELPPATAEIDPDSCAALPWRFPNLHHLLDAQFRSANYHFDTNP